MSKFTKGPWSFEYDNSDTGAGQWYTISANDGDALWFPYNATKEDEEEKLANAQLISCAPDMYAMLEEIESFSSFTPENQDLKDIAVSVRKLLAKARGEHEPE